jgi:hypothetical protein
VLRRLTLTAALLALAAPGVAAARETGIADLAARAAYALRAVGDAQGAIPVGDVDGDGHVDAGVLEEGGDLRIVAGGGAVRVVGGLDHDSDAFDDPRTAGDVDGDGFDDIALTGFPGTGAELEDDAPVVLAQVVLGGPRLRGERDARRPGRLGFAIRGRAPDLGSLFFLLPAPAGDVDGDGLDDLALGAPLAGLARGDARPGASDADTFARFPGAVFVVHGRRERTPVRLGGPGCSASTAPAASSATRSPGRGTWTATGSTTSRSGRRSRAEPGVGSAARTSSPGRARGSVARPSRRSASA